MRREDARGRAVRGAAGADDVRACACVAPLRSEAVAAAATSGDARFFLGTDSAPHARGAKECACGCAGIFSAHAALPLYAAAFEAAGALQHLEGFASLHGPAFYRRQPSEARVTLRREAWTVPDEYVFGDATVVPFMAGQAMAWRVLEAEQR